MSSTAKIGQHRQAGGASLGENQRIATGVIFLSPISLLSRLRRSQQIILALFEVVITSGFLARTTGHRVLGGFLFALSILGVLGLLAFLLVRPLARKLLWRVRDRLFVTYFLAGAVPVVLLLLLGCLGFSLVLNQTADYMLHAELSRHLEQLQTSAERLALDVASGRGPTESMARGEGAVIRNGNRVSSIPYTTNGFVHRAFPNPSSVDYNASASRPRLSRKYFVATAQPTC